MISFLISGINYIVNDKHFLYLLENIDFSLSLFVFI